MNSQLTYVMINPIEDFFHLLNNVVSGESTIEDIILLVGTLVAFIAFILWCCFPVTPKNTPLPDKRSPELKAEQIYKQLVMDNDGSVT